MRLIYALAIVLVFSLSISVYGMYQTTLGKIQQLDRILEDIQAMKMEEEEIKADSVLAFMQTINMKFPKVAYAQSLLETGNYTSRIFVQNNNLFGMKKAYTRPTTCKEVRDGYCVYDDWRDSVIDYAIYQRVFMKDAGTRDEYLTKLGRSYAEDPRYPEKLKRIISQM